MTKPTIALALILASMTVAQAQSVPEPQYRAQYRLNYIADWSAGTHPDEFPPSPHFSPLIGALHNQDAVIWRDGELASDGIEAMAELGATFTLSAEINQLIAAGSADSIVTGPGIGLSPGAGVIEFDVRSDYSRVSLTTMLAPSPDWFVGVDSLSLRDGNNWRDQIELDLFTYDAGTDSGPNYTSANDDTNPAQPIALITDPPFDNNVPVMRFVFTLLGTQDFFPLEGHHSGLYSDPARDGEGVNLSIAEFADRWAVTATWFTYLDGQQLWLVGSADIEPGDDSVTLDLYVTSGADFGAEFDPDDVVVTFWGSAIVRVPKCGFLQLDYSSDDGQHNGTLNLSQLVPIGQLDCP